MGFTESEHHSKCPCYGKGEDFQIVVDLKDTGLVIYRYIDRKKNLDQTAHTDNNTTESAIILQNTKNMNLLSAELLPELDKNKITCPRCRQILRHTQELLNKIPGIDKSDVLGICDHCRLKAQTQKPCNECGKIVRKFLAIHRKQKGDSKKYVKLWLTSIGHVLDGPHKITTRTCSEKDLDLSVLEIGKSVGKLGTQPMFHSETNLSDSNLLKTRMPQKPPPLSLDKGVHFRESYKPAETFPMTRSDSKLIVSRVDSIQEKEDHISEHDTNKAIKHSHLTEDEINIQRRMTKYRHDKEEVELAIKTKEERLSEYKNFMKSQKQFSDPDLQKDFSFFFPEVSQQSLRKPIGHVSSSQIIRFIQKKIGLKSGEEEMKIEKESKRRLEMDEKRISREEKIMQDKDKDTTAEEQNKTGMRETLTDQEQKKIYEKDKVGIKRQLEGEHAKTTDSSSSSSSSSIKELKRATVTRNTRKIKEEESDMTIKKVKQKDKEIDKVEYRKRDRVGKPIKTIDDPYTQRFRQTDEKSKAFGEQKKLIDGQKPLAAGKELRKTISKEFKEKEIKRGHVNEGKIKEKYKDAKGEKLIATQGKAQTTKKDTIQTIPKKADALLKSERREKDTETTKFKKLEKGQDYLKKLFGGPKPLSDLKPSNQVDKQSKEKKDKKINIEEGIVQAKSKDFKGDKSVPAEDKTQVVEKHTTHKTSKKADPILKSEQNEKDKEVKRSKNIEKSQENLRKLFNAPKLLSDQADKQLIEKVDKKRQLEEKEIQSKLKDIKTKEKPMLPSEIQSNKVTTELPAKTDTTPKVKQKGQELQEPHKERSVEIKMAAIKKQRPSKDEFMQLIVQINKKPTTRHELAEANKKTKKDDPLNKPLREAKAVVKPEPKRPVPPPTTPTKTVSEQQVSVKMTQIELHKPNTDDKLLNLIRIKQSVVPRRQSIHGMPPVDLLLMKYHESHKQLKNKSCIICNDSELSLKCDLYNTQILHPAEIEGIIIGEDLLKQRPSFFPVHVEQQHVVPLLFKSEYFEKPPSEPREHIKEVSEEDNNNKVDPEAKKGIIRYALSDRSFIDKGWTLLPTEKVVRKMNVYRMRPAHPEFDWFEHNKHKRYIQYDTCEKFAEFDDNGRGRWYYKNGRLALDYYDAEETNAQQRFVVYSSGEPDERGRSHPITVLATFDYLGNGIVLDHAGKIRLKYNQTEGVVLDRSIGPVSHWKWHTLNDPPVLQQVMIDTQMSHKDPYILKLGGPADNKTRPDNEEMLAIEFDNFVKDKNKKLSQTFKPFQIKMKALKINEHFSLRVLDQATIYLIFRDGSTNLKLNIGMILDHHEIVDTDTAEVGEVSNNLERLPARTDSLAGMQRSIAFAQRYERNRTERERRLRPSELCASADHLVAAVSRPLRTPLRTVPLAPTGSTSNTEFCRCYRKPSSNLYYNTRLT